MLFKQFGDSMAVAKETGPYKWGFLLGLGRFGNIVSATEYFGDGGRKCFI